ncbi:MAG: hypothetical protein KF773_30965 [Deltaproteobacteria bacterium]|nr:hypothetical protein [Deltaproteobacteria bacterium]
MTFVLSLMARKANDLIQAVFGWSVTTLFGRLQRREQVLVTGALVLSLFWPLFVAGIAAPGVASWAIALVPLHDWIGEGRLRIAWLVFALGSPLVVGALVHLAAPRRSRSVVAVARGLPVALGFAAAFAVVVITVPLVKLISLVRRWSDEHVYVQPREGAYDEAVICLAEACRRAGLVPRIDDAPPAMTLATHLMRLFARGAVAPFVGARLRRVTATGVELYLYPGDLLLRGEPFVVARVRAMLARTELDARAYLVGSEEGKAIQDRLARIALDLRRTHGSAAERTVERLSAVYRRILHADVGFVEWIVLDGIARKLERRMVIAGLVATDELPIDATADAAASGTAVRSSTSATGLAAQAHT